MLLITLSLLLAADPLSELKLAAPGLTASGLEASAAAPLTDHLAQAFIGVRVISPRDISVLLGLERQKQLLGCSDDAAECIAELGNALGVQGVLLGSVVKLGKSVQISVRIIDPVAGRELASASARVDSEDAIFDALTRTGRQLRTQFLTAMGRAVEPVAVSSGGTRRFFPIPLAVGGVGVASGVACIVLSEGAWQRLTAGAAGSLSNSDAQGVASNGQLFQTLGVTLITVGIVAAAVGGGLLLFGSTADSDQASATLGLSQNAIVVTGTF